MTRSDGWHSRPASANASAPPAIPGGGMMDSDMLLTVLLVPVGYLLGMFPTAVLVARAKGVDVTAAGSGNPGASNVARLLGWKWGALVMASDFAKGALAAGL